MATKFYKSKNNNVDINFKDLDELSFFKTEKDCSGFTMVEINGKTYRINSTIKDKENEINYVSVSKIDIDLSKTKSCEMNSIRCPICGYMKWDSFGLDYVTGEYKCSRCGSTLLYKREIITTYNTTVTEKTKIIKLK